MTIVNGDDIWDIVSSIYSWLSRKDSKGDDIVDRAEMKRVEELRVDYIRGQRVDYRCTKCKGDLVVVEFVYGNVTIIKVSPCNKCMDLSEQESYIEGFN